MPREYNEGGLSSQSFGSYIMENKGGIAKAIEMTTAISESPELIGRMKKKNGNDNRKPFGRTDRGYFKVTFRRSR